MEGHIGGDEHPDMPWHLRQVNQQRDLYTDIFRQDREGRFLIVDDHVFGRVPSIRRSDDNDDEYDILVNRFMDFFGRFPDWARAAHPWMNGSLAGGDGCERCSVRMNLLNSSQPMNCDVCEREMDDEMSANPNVLFAFGRGGLTAVA